MKTTIDSIKGDERAKITIKLADDCKNGHADFSVTATLYERVGATRWREWCGGCCHGNGVGLFGELCRAPRNRAFS